MPGFIGMPELLLLGLVCLILFGPKRLPEMGRGLGKGMREFKDSISNDTHKDGVDLAKLEVPQTVVVEESHAEELHKVA
jgi:sec-independent protein translocase protein TatA